MDDTSVRNAGAAFSLDKNNPGFIVWGFICRNLLYIELINTSRSSQEPLNSPSLSQSVCLQEEINKQGIMEG